MSQLDGLTEEQLVERIVRGDEAALGRLYALVSPRAWAVARRILRNDAEAEEVLQDAFLEVWRSATRYDPRRAAPSRWILTMVRARAIERLRRDGARGRLADHLGAVPPAPSATPDAQVGLARDAKRLRHAMTSLPEEQRRVLERAYDEGLTQSEIAELTQTPLGTVKTRMRTAMLRLAELLDG